nr:MAG TPA_asm: hypothetical protein [Caudoviricetes sp.]
MRRKCKSVDKISVNIKIKLYIGSLFKRPLINSQYPF